MKSLVTYINEASHDAENTLSVVKKLINKTLSLDDINKELAEEGWEFVEEVPGKNGDNDMLVYACNFTNNAEGDDDFLDIEVEKHGNKYKVLSYTLE